MSTTETRDDVENKISVEVKRMVGHPWGHDSVYAQARYA